MISKIYIFLSMKNLSAQNKAKYIKKKTVIL